MFETHPNFKSFIPSITNGMKLYSDLFLVLQFQRLFHKIIPPCEENAWLENKQNPNFFVIKHQEVDRVYKYLKTYTNNAVQYKFLGRINNNDDNGNVYYIYVNGIITRDYHFFRDGKRKFPSIVNGFIFLSENLNLFLRCVFAQYFQTNAFNLLYNGIFKEDNDNFQESYSNLPLQKQQRILTNLVQRNTNTLLNTCIQMVRNNMQFYELPPDTIIKDIIEEENITEAVAAFTKKKKQRQPHKRAICKVCCKNGNYINNNNNYYLLHFNTGIHQLNQNQLCVEMLNFHCDNILNYQYLFQKRRIDDCDNILNYQYLFKKRKIDDYNDDDNAYTTIQPQDIDRLYYIHNGYFDLDKTHLCEHEGHEVTVVGRMAIKTNCCYFYINGYTLLPRRGDYKGGFIFWAKDVNLLMKFVIMNLKSINDKRVIEKNLLVNDGIIINNNNDDDDEIYRLHLKSDGWDKNYYDIFLNSRTSSHYANCRICFYAKFNPELLDRLIYSQGDFILVKNDDSNKHCLNKDHLHPAMLNYYCDHVLNYQHLFIKKIPPHEENYLRPKIENFTINVQNIDQIYYIYNELYDLPYSRRKDQGYMVEISGRIIINSNNNKEEMMIYFNLTAWTMTRRAEDIGNFKWGFIFFSADLDLFMDIILPRYTDNEWRQFIINKVKKEDNYLIEEQFIEHINDDYFIFTNNINDDCFINNNNKEKGEYYFPDYRNMLNETKRVLYDKTYKMIKFSLIQPHHYLECKLCANARTNPKLCNRLLSNNNSYEIFGTNCHHRLIKKNVRVHSNNNI